MELLRQRMSDGRCFVAIGRKGRGWNGQIVGAAGGRERWGVPVGL